MRWIIIIIIIFFIIIIISVAGPTAWNGLPPDIRTASTLGSFKNLLKTHLFFHSFQLST